ncbi:hypothetical protein PVAP13_2NG042119 [Panicum virgatum]|uniref:Uncharacterized protein n=1 Tax=Panicum virgatum TaxID=38727 RepID=A0A8T0VBG1_PANVG|nr:hypothetical protein PVAP13_2NG042119 [Panicum virgatum]
MRPVKPSAHMLRCHGTGRQAGARRPVAAMDPELRDESPPGSPSATLTEPSTSASTSQDIQGIDAQLVEGTGKMDKEVDQLLATLKSAGKEIDDETVRIIEDQIARIKAEAARARVQSNAAVDEAKCL